MRTFKYRWSSALGTSLACHVVALGLITGFMLLFPASPVNKGPIEVDLVTMSGGGGGVSAGPATMNVTLNANGISDPVKLARMIEPELARLQRLAR